MAKRTSGSGAIGILTAGGDCPGLNAVIRGVAKAAMHNGLRVIGIQDGFRGLVENRFVPLDNRSVSGILTQGGTFLGSSRDKPHKMPMGDRVLDMTDVAVANYNALNLDCLVCLGGNGTMKNAYRLHQKGLNVLTLPKTIDNDVAETDITFGFDSAMTIATEAIDRLHTTATSHHRIILCEIMGHEAGWLCLGSGIAGGADIILIPEIPYDLECIRRSLLQRRRTGKRFSIIAVAEGVLSRDEAAARAAAEAAKRTARTANETGGRASTAKKTRPRGARPAAKEGPASGALSGESAPVEPASAFPHLVQESVASRLAREIQQITGVEARVTSLGHVQRGGTPTAFDRLLCTRLGTKAGELLAARHYNVMVGVRGTECVPIPLSRVAGLKRIVPPDHPWITAARLVETSFGDEGP